MRREKRSERRRPSNPTEEVSQSGKAPQPDGRSQPIRKSRQTRRNKQTHEGKQLNPQAEVDRSGKVAQPASRSQPIRKSRSPRTQKSTNRGKQLNPSVDIDQSGRSSQPSAEINHSGRVAQHIGNETNHRQPRIAAVEIHQPWKATQTRR